MKLTFKTVIQPAVILLAICVVVTAALAVTNTFTYDRIEAQKILSAENARKTVLPQADSFEEGDGFHVGYSGESTVGYVFVTETKSGYGGTVGVMTGIDTAGQITGVVILEHNETPGLGANAEKSDFLSQYLQPADTPLEVIKFQKPVQGQIEAITGATITSKAVTDAVNDAIALYGEVSEK